MTKQSRPPVDPSAARGLVEPSPRDRERIREELDRALARGSASQTVLRVDALMAQRALGAAPGAAFYGSKAALAKLVIPAVLIGAGVGAIWARTLFAPSAHSEVPARSLPVQVEDLGDEDSPAADFASRGPTVEPLAFYGSPPTAAAPRDEARAARDTKITGPSGPSASHAKARHHGHLPTTGARVMHHAPAATSDPAPIAELEPDLPPGPDTHSHHLAEELRLMRAASAALAADDIPRTLNLLSQHAERFPDGALREERRALRVISLCKQGRSHFALVERDEFLSSSPRSPLTARVREACELPR